MTHRKVQGTRGGRGEGVRSNLPEFRGQFMINEIHITLWIKLCHISKICAPTELSVFVCLSVFLVKYLVP